MFVANSVSRLSKNIGKVLIPLSEPGCANVADSLACRAFRVVLWVVQQATLPLREISAQHLPRDRGRAWR